jgi:hypothetical protein
MKDSNPVSPTAPVSVWPRGGFSLCEDPNCKFRIKPHYHESGHGQLSDEVRRDIEEIKRVTIRR